MASQKKNCMGAIFQNWKNSDAECNYMQRLLMLKGESSLMCESVC